jgi:hypothetical protein
MNIKPLSFTLKIHNGVARTLITDVHIEKPLHKGGDVVPPPSGPIFKAIWDTGATNTVITSKVVTACSLLPVGMIKVRHAQGEKVTPEYFVSIYLPNSFAIPIVRVNEGVLGDSADVLIGMDVISTGDFSITNKDNETWFSFRMPSIQRIDFVKHYPHPEHGCLCGSGKKYKNCCGNGLTIKR